MQEFWFSSRAERRQPAQCLSPNKPSIGTWQLSRWGWNSPRWIHQGRCLALTQPDFSLCERSDLFPYFWQGLGPSGFPKHSSSQTRTNRKLKVCQETKIKEITIERKRIMVKRCFLCCHFTLDFPNVPWGITNSFLLKMRNLKDNMANRGFRLSKKCILMHWLFYQLCLKNRKKCLGV